MPKVNAVIGDRNHPKWTAKTQAKSVPLSGLPNSLQHKLKAISRGAQKTPTKQSVTIRLSPDVLAALKASGSGWQTRVNQALRVWVTKQPKLLAPTSKAARKHSTAA